MPDLLVRDRDRLPHWEIEGGTYFVTFRLADSLPQPVLRGLVLERLDIVRTAREQSRELTALEQKRLDQLFSERVDKYLDSGVGACYLARADIASLVADAIRYFDGNRYCLAAWCLMPNHVHTVFKVLPGQSLDKILHSWKSFTAHKANAILGNTVPFWQREYYDRLVRNDEEFHQFIRYTANNPERAGLKNWKWVWAPSLDRF